MPEKSRDQKFQHADPWTAQPGAGSRSSRSSRSSRRPQQPQQAAAQRQVQRATSPGWFLFCTRRLTPSVYGFSVEGWPGFDPPFEILRRQTTPCSGPCGG